MPITVVLDLDPEKHQPDNKSPEDTCLTVKQRRTLRRALGIRTPLETAIELGKEVVEAAKDFTRGISTPPSPER